MTINFDCLKCGKKIKAPDATAGRKVLCPSCNGKVTVPGERSEVAKPPLPKIESRADSEPEYQLEELIVQEATPLVASLPPVPYERTMQLSDPIEFELPTSRRYLALTIVRYSLLVFAALAACGWVVSLVLLLIATFAGAANDRAAGAGILVLGSGYLFIQLIVVGVFCCCTIAASELIKLWIDVQENTLAAAHYSRSAYLNRQ
jgi:DNA-directed RNA polymerase subunit RPC12/RpoP